MTDVPSGNGTKGIALVETPANIASIGSLTPRLQQTIASIAQLTIPDHGWLGQPGKVGSPAQIIDVTDEFATDIEQVVWIQYAGVRFNLKDRFDRSYVDIFPVSYAGQYGRMHFPDGGDPTQPPINGLP